MWSTYTHIILVVPVVVLVAVVCCALDPRHFAVRFDKITADYDAEFIRINITHNGSVANLRADVLRPLNKLTLHLNLMIKMRDFFGGSSAANDALRRRSSTAGFTNFMNQTLDYCKFLSDPGSDVFLRGMYEHVLTDPRNKYFARCPIAVDHYYVRDFTIDLGNLPPSLPSLYFNLFMCVHHRRSKNQTDQLSMLYEHRVIGQIGPKQALARRHRKP